MSSLVQFPEWSNGNIAITVLQVAGLGSFANEVMGQNAGYSKFANVTKAFKVQSRTGMLLLYSPALAVALAYLKTPPVGNGGGNGREQITAALLAFHFGKRVLECLFLHNYSGTMDGDFLVPISTSYALTAALCAYQQRRITEYVHPSSGTLFNIGIGLSFLGQLGNFYHHYLLTTLRKNSNSSEKKYVIPTGGLFSFVTMPHYLFELVAWLGIACVTQQFNAFLTVADMTSYLAGRSVATTRWYRSKFPNYPAERKHLIPFLF